MARTSPKNRAALALVGGLAALVVASGVYEQRAEAQTEIQLTGPLKGAPAVRRLRLYREGRIELAPSITSTILDEYRRTFLVGARFNYGITDWLGVGAWVAYGALNTTTSLTDQIDSSPRSQSPNPSLINVPSKPGPNGVAARTDGSFKDQVASIGLVAMPQVTAVPFRGKFALFQSIFADVDAYLFAGFGYVGTKERKDCANFVDCANDHGTTSKGHFAPTWGLGFNFYLNGLVSLGLEYRMIPFAWNRGGFDTRGLDANQKESSSGKFPDGRIDKDDSTLRFNQMISLFVGFSFPQKPKITD